MSKKNKPVIYCYHFWWYGISFAAWRLNSVGFNLFFSKHFLYFCILKKTATAQWIARFARSWSLNWLFYVRSIWYIICLCLLQVVEVSTSKTGKHGHAKCHFVAIDIFTSKKLEDIVPSSHNCDVCVFLIDA